MNITTSSVPSDPAYIATVYETSRKFLGHSPTFSDDVAVTFDDDSNALPSLRIFIALSDNFRA
jgi:hypothetical protein